VKTSANGLAAGP